MRIAREVVIVIVTCRTEHALILTSEIERLHHIYIIICWRRYRTGIIKYVVIYIYIYIYIYKIYTYGWLDTNTESYMHMYYTGRHMVRVSDDNNSLVLLFIWGQGVIRHRGAVKKWLYSSHVGSTVSL